MVSPRGAAGGHAEKGFADVMERVKEACSSAGRSVDEVVVVAVSKGRTSSEILEVYERGHRDFGENRVQELARKAPRLPDDIRWHFVGPLQRNKVRVVRPLTNVLHSMDRPSLAGAWLKGAGMAPPVYIEVNIGGEPQKSGVAPDDLPDMVDLVTGLGVEVRGLMALPPQGTGPEDARPHFRRLAGLRDGLAVPTARGLSMGMTEDFEVAIEEGATIIRVGRAIFGATQEREAQDQQYRI